MAQHALGTLMLPWSTSTQRATKRVPVDPALLAVTLILALVGVVMVFSASAVVAGNRFHDPWYFLKRQLAWLGAGLLVMHLISKIDYTIWKKLAIPLLFGTTVLLMLVLVPSFGSVAKGARRWLHLGPLNIQPAELAKYAVAIYIAAYLTKKQDQITNFSRGLLPPLIVLGLLSGLVLLEPDLGTVVVMGLVVVAMLFLAGFSLQPSAVQAGSDPVDQRCQPAKDRDDDGALLMSEPAAATLIKILSETYSIPDRHHHRPRLTLRFQTSLHPILQPLRRLRQHLRRDLHQ